MMAATSTCVSALQSCVFHRCVTTRRIAAPIAANVPASFATQRSCRNVCVSVRDRLVKWAYSSSSAAEVLSDKEEWRSALTERLVKPTEGSNGVGHTNATASVVVCFPGDRLPAHLRGVKAAALSRAEAAEVARFVERGASAAAKQKDATVNKIAAAEPIRHVLDLQEPAAIASVLEATFESGEMPAEGADEEDETSSALHTAHYIIVFGQSITAQGYSVYSQLFPRGQLTSSGEPLRGTYAADTAFASAAEGGAAPQSLAAVGAIVADALAVGAQQHYRASSALSSAPPPQEGVAYSSPHVSSIDIVGFSKGCTALNQIIADVGAWGAPLRSDNSSREEPSTRGLGSGLSNGRWCLGVHYIDGGLNSAGAFLSDRRALEAFRGAFSLLPAGGGAVRSPRGLLPFPLGGEGEEAGTNEAATVCGVPLRFRDCAAATVSVYSTPRQRMDPHHPFLDYERRVMAMHLCAPVTAARGGTGAAAEGATLFVPPPPPMEAPRYFTIRPANANVPNGSAPLVAAAAARGAAKPIAAPVGLPVAGTHAMRGATAAFPHNAHASLAASSLFAVAPSHPSSVRGIASSAAPSCSLPHLSRSDSSEAVRDWAVTAVAPPTGGGGEAEKQHAAFTVRVLEDVPPPSPRRGGLGEATAADKEGDDEEGEEEDGALEMRAAMIGLRQHMLALVRFGEKH